MESEDDGLVGRLESVEKLLQEYETKIHLDKIVFFEPRLNITAEYMLAMDMQDLQVLSWEYAQYSLAIQKELNKQIRRFNWTEANLKRYLESICQQYEGWKWEERQSNALNDNSYAQKLFQLKTKTKLAIDTLSFLPSKIEFLSKLVSDILKTKRYSNE